MPLTKELRESVVKEFQKHPKDCGSEPIQVALLTNRINELTEHLKLHPKDFHSQRGLIKMVGQRKRLLAYLRRKSPELYKKTIEKLELRK